MKRLFSCLIAFFILAVGPAAQAALSVDSVRIGHGVRAWYAANDTVPVVHATLVFEGAGSVSDPAGQAGRAALAAAMLSEGAGALDAVAFRRALENKAIQLTIESSADRLTITLHCLREDAARAGELLALALSQPRFAAADLARVKTQTLSLLSRLKESPGYIAGRMFEQVAFAGHPYASPHYGTPRSIAAITGQDLRDYMATYVTRGNVLVTAAGDVNAHLLDTMLGPVIDALGRSEAGPVRVIPVEMRGAGETRAVPMTLPQSAVLFAAPAVPRADKRFYAFYLLNEVLGGNGLTSRLATGLRQDKGLVYSVGTQLSELEGITLLRGMLASRAERAAEATQAVQAVLRDVQNRGVSTRECEDARAHVLGAFPLQLDSSRSVAGMLMAMRIHGLGMDYLATRQEKFAAVRCADVNALAREYLAPERFLFVTAGDDGAR